MRKNLNVRFHRAHPTTEGPAYALPGDAGADIRCTAPITLAPGERRLVDTGLTLEFPTEFAAFIHPRSGLGHRHGISIVNTPGTIEGAYRGTVQVNLINHGADMVYLEADTRIAQIVFQEVCQATFIEVDSVDDLTQTERGSGGHGSTGN